MLRQQPARDHAGGARGPKMTEETITDGRHDGVRYAIEAYITSDSTELETMVRLGSPTPIPPVKKNYQS
jgi:hypothetical protein